MTDREILDAAILNGIAIDLGLPTFSNFVDGSTYQTDALNGITSALVGKGVTSELNKCAVTLNSTTITVATGLIIFESGAKKKIVTPLTLNLIANVTNYVYAKNDTTLNVIVIETSATAPTGDYVLLAEIESGVVTDKRNWALMKNASVLPNSTLVFDQSSAISSVNGSFDITVNPGNYVNSKYIILEISAGKTLGQYSVYYRMRIYINLIDMTCGGHWSRISNYSANYVYTASNLALTNGYLAFDTESSTANVAITLNKTNQTLRITSPGLSVTEVNLYKSLIITCI